MPDGAEGGVAWNDISDPDIAAVVVVDAMAAPLTVDATPAGDGKTAGNTHPIRIASFPTRREGSGGEIELELSL